ncbi:hypothetical protein HEQ62_10085 [Haematospirillum jordaniae]|uniref:PhiE125 gp8 family phage protein n=1 Tax=Haematospirillum jordaniae TaxID=1549855 RepID=A0A143DDT3_9PROT|nr:head-tail connector protein [Haematospirillum jordaniae]AMW34288.1 hypothetical protein AY555_02795 [Haematospirillum jordaniae]NKD46171.1 hypothetical protein [Haematospirillum jordaniae]NKD58044.1 hypothetical protein [Haematospirillum jordaniae]NKD60118.1 hypothetical protein [Haematospirillum jordaniae]NKD68117.1 hypothetical protein [Haematospirillum jordaniae]
MLIEIQAPETEPVSLSDAKIHLRVDHTAEDDYIASLLSVARRQVEQYCGRALSARKWRLLLDSFPPRIELPCPPLQSVDALSCIDSGGRQRVLPPECWQIGHGCPSAIMPAPGHCWPQTASGRPDAVLVDFTAGYSDRRDVDPALRHAMLLLVANWFENRGTASESGSRHILPPTVRYLLDPCRIRTVP